MVAMQLREPQSELYDFNDTLARLEDIIDWLSSCGLTMSHNRVSIYRQNIRKMVEVERRGQMETLQGSISIKKAREVFWSYIDADEFVRAVSALRMSLGDAVALGPIERALNGPADLAFESCSNNEGRNFMFELIVAGRFAASGFRPSFDKGPDVQVQFAGLEVAIQCKRPFSPAKLEQNISKAIHQLRGGQADLNLIAVSVSRLLCAAEPVDIPRVLHRRLGHLYLKPALENIAEHTSRFWRGKMERAAIWFYAFMPFRCVDRPQYFPQRQEIISPLCEGEPTRTLLHCLVRSINA